MAGAVRLTPTATIAAITAWPDSGRPDPATRLRDSVAGIAEAARGTPPG